MMIVTIVVVLTLSYLLFKPRKPGEVTLCVDVAPAKLPELDESMIPHPIEITPVELPEEVKLRESSQPEAPRFGPVKPKRTNVSKRSNKRKSSRRGKKQ